VSQEPFHELTDDGDARRSAMSILVEAGCAWDGDGERRERREKNKDGKESIEKPKMNDDLFCAPEIARRAKVRSCG
jgi:hypothetical protein